MMKKSEDNKVHDKGKKRIRSRRHRLRVRLLFLLAVFPLLIIYLGTAFFYEKHYFPRTQIAEFECGNQTPEVIHKKLKEQADHYTLTICDRSGGQSVVHGSDMEYGYRTSGEEEQILDRQNGFLWPVELSGEKIYELHHSSFYNEDSLRRVVSVFSFMQPENMEAPQDAVLTITDTGYELVEEIQGNTVIKEQVFAEIMDAADSQKSEVTLSDACYKRPVITAETPRIVNLTAQFDRYLASVITYEIEGREEILDSGKIASMLLVSEDDVVSVDEDALTAYVQSLASNYNTYGRKREFRTSAGDTVTIGGGDYGWVVAKEEEKEQILKDLEGGVPVTREPVYEQTALYRGADDVGNTYVEIDYTNQHLYYYQDGVLAADTDIVSGNISRNNGSPDGVFKIVYKKSPATLTGEDYQSAVEYFMPFAYNVGIHDASWRSSFGGNIYKTSGSHGCINVPAQAAEKLYRIVDTGTPVIAYYREEVLLTAENARISNAYSYRKKENRIAQ